MTERDPRGAASPQVSFDDEPLVLVDENNHVVGYEQKLACHVGDGILHRAFSVFLFDGEGRCLVQKRAAAKPLWPLFWSNSVCSHPRRGEDELEAVHRRIIEEVGTDAEVEFVYRFQYHARFGDAGSERENCAVYLGRANGEIAANENEIAEWQWMTPEEIDAAIEARPETFTPWMKMEWARLRGEFRDRLAARASSSS
jgi:isopentenyl-diphosphate delta-isomerase